MYFCKKWIEKKMKNENLIKSPMNYTGGKYKLLKQILPLFPENIEGRFIDLFCGGLDISINVNSCKKILSNDINTKIIEVYTIMKDSKAWYEIIHNLKLVSSFGILF